jgi:ribosome-associated protein
MPRRSRRQDAAGGRPDRPSKSQRKRESTALQALGVALADAPPDVVEGLELPDRLVRAIEELRRLSSHGAVRRQRQYVGKLMRDVDPEPIRRALSESGQEDAAARRRFRLAEMWRDRILSEGPPAISACAETLPIDAEALTSFYGTATGTGSEISRKTAARQLFRHIHAAAGADKLP